MNLNVDPVIVIGWEMTCISISPILTFLRHVKLWEKKTETRRNEGQRDKEGIKPRRGEEQTTQKSHCSSSTPPTNRVHRWISTVVDEQFCLTVTKNRKKLYTVTQFKLPSE